MYIHCVDRYQFFDVTEQIASIYLTTTLLQAILIVGGRLGGAQENDAGTS